MLYDIFLGFLLLSVFLNFINGKIPSLFRDLSEQTKLALYSSIIICMPSLFSITFSGSGNRSTTFVTSIFTAAITLMVRELFVWWKERMDIRDEIFNELYGNYRALKSLVNFYLSLQGQPSVDITYSSNDIKQRWTDQVFKSHFGKLQSKNIYSQEIIDEIRGIYEDMNTAIDGIDRNDPQWNMDFVVRTFLNAKSQGTLFFIKNLLIHLDESKAYQFLQSENI
jgi:hypothetical protein